MRVRRRGSRAWRTTPGSLAASAPPQASQTAARTAPFLARPMSERATPNLRRRFRTPREASTVRSPGATGVSGRLSLSPPHLLSGLLHTDPIWLVGDLPELGFDPDNFGNDQARTLDHPRSKNHDPKNRPSSIYCASAHEGRPNSDPRCLHKPNLTLPSLAPHAGVSACQVWERRGALGRQGRRRREQLP